ncbi:MAG TPA: caspase family protein [Cytophagales bacterium]|nr:caspase family protein [Cytophagales bacterium]
MSKGISLHIGLNYVNPDAYNGWDGALAGCINDANSMQAIAMSQGFQTEKLIDSQATSSQVVAKICQMSQQLQSGDIFLLTYSGHGGQLPDQTGTEEDGMDETWVLWDRELLDNELYCLWSRFASGVRIFVSSDSCHSGTVVKMLYRKQVKQRNKLVDIQALKNASNEQMIQNKLIIGSNLQNMQRSAREPKPRFIPVDVSFRAFEKKKDQYKYAGYMAGPKEQNTIQAQVVYISGCQDNQFSYDGDQNGYFTGKLLQVWNNGAFSGSHQNFYNEISALMPSYQTPNFMTLGIPIDGFIDQKPYTVQFAGTTGGEEPATPVVDTQEPSLSAPASWGRNNAAPTFQINKGSNSYYYVEVTSDVQLFNYDQNGHLRSKQNFYGTWENDSEVSPRLTNTAFQLPMTAWNNLKNNNKLFYRVGTTSSSDPYSWDNHMVSLSEGEFDMAKFIQIVAVQTPAEPTPESPQGQTISASVGKGGVNNPADVRMIQELLNQIPENDGGPAVPLDTDGLIGKKTIRAIEDYQEAQGLSVDGLITPDGFTFAALVSREIPVLGKNKPKSKNELKEKTALSETYPA